MWLDGFFFLDIGRPGVLGDSTIYSLSELKRNIGSGVWLGKMFRT